MTKPSDPRQPKKKKSKAKSKKKRTAKKAKTKKKGLSLFAAEQVDCDTLCRAHSVQIDNRADLVSVLARLAAGEHMRLQGIIRALRKDKLKVADFSPLDEAIDAAVAALTLKKTLANDGEKAVENEIYHRDGWLFQLISWTAACQFAGPHDRIRSPHMVKAHKGFDGLAVALSPKGDLRGLIISEDKASKNARKKIRDQVWPDIEALEENARIGEIVAGVAPLLEFVNPDLAENLAKKVCWEEQRWFRVAVTADSGAGSAAKLKKLFKGYDDRVDGALERRNGEAFLLSPAADVRKFLQALSDDVVTELESLRS